MRMCESEKTKMCQDIDNVCLMGVTLSRGPNQRVAIAWPLVKNPSLLVLDKATSALDAESETIVQEVSDTVSKGKTVQVIAHRLSTIKNANLFTVVFKGKMAEMGTHEVKGK